MAEVMESAEAWIHGNFNRSAVHILETCFAGEVTIVQSMTNGALTQGLEAAWAAAAWVPGSPRTSTCTESRTSAVADPELPLAEAPPAAAAAPAAQSMLQEAAAAVLPVGA